MTPRQGSGQAPRLRSGQAAQLSSAQDVHEVPHIMPLGVYYGIFGLLMLCTALTVGAAYLDLGVFNTPVALVIAVFKAVIVVLYFMHVKYSPRLIWLVVVGGLFWFGILMVYTFGDYLTRGWLTFG